MNEKSRYRVSRYLMALVGVDLAAAEGNAWCEAPPGSAEGGEESEECLAPAPEPPVAALAIED